MYGTIDKLKIQDPVFETFEIESPASILFVTVPYKPNVLNKFRKLIPVILQAIQGL
jgi:hypothetical protein